MRALTKAATPRWLEVVFFFLISIIYLCDIFYFLCTPAISYSGRMNTIAVFVLSLGTMLTALVCAITSMAHPHIWCRRLNGGCERTWCYPCAVKAARLELELRCTRIFNFVRPCGAMMTSLSQKEIDVAPVGIEEVWSYQRSHDIHGYVELLAIPSGDHVYIVYIWKTAHFSHFNRLDCCSHNPCIPLASQQTPRSSMVLVKSKQSTVIMYLKM